MKVIYYQYMYFRFGQLVCGVRLYKTDEQWKQDHPGISYAKKIPHEVEEE